MKKNIWALSTFYSTNAAIDNVIMIQENAQERAKLDLMFQDINQKLLELCE